MTARIRTLLFLSTLTIVLAACGTATGSPASEAPDPTQPVPSVEPSQSPEAPSEEREVAGTITIAEMAFSGPGGTIAEALVQGSTGNELPTLVNGVLFRDTDGTIYLATSVSDTSTPTFDGPMLEVLNMDNEGNSWDMANAELLGLEEANGIVFNQNAQILGFLEVK